MKKRVNWPTAKEIYHGEMGHSSYAAIVKRPAPIMMNQRNHPSTTGTQVAEVAHETDKQDDPPSLTGKRLREGSTEDVTDPLRSKRGKEDPSSKATNDADTIHNAFENLIDNNMELEEFSTARLENKNKTTNSKTTPNVCSIPPSNANEPSTSQTNRTSAIPLPKKKHPEPKPPTREKKVNKHNDSTQKLNKSARK